MIVVTLFFIRLILLLTEFFLSHMVVMVVGDNLPAGYKTYPYWRLNVTLDLFFVLDMTRRCDVPESDAFDFVVKLANRTDFGSNENKVKMAFATGVDDPQFRFGFDECSDAFCVKKKMEAMKSAVQTLNNPAKVYNFAGALDYYVKVMKSDEANRVDALDLVFALICEMPNVGYKPKIQAVMKTAVMLLAVIQEEVAAVKEEDFKPFTNAENWDDWIFTTFVLYVSPVILINPILRHSLQCIYSNNQTPCFDLDGVNCTKHVQYKLADAKTNEKLCPPEKRETGWVKCTAEECFDARCDNSSGHWTAWTACSVTCGEGGVHTRTRTVDEQKCKTQDSKLCDSMEDCNNGPAEIETAAPDIALTGIMAPIVVLTLLFVGVAVGAILYYRYRQKQVDAANSKGTTTKNTTGTEDTTHRTQGTFSTDGKLSQDLPKSKASQDAKSKVSWDPTAKELMKSGSKAMSTNKSPESPQKNKMVANG